MSDITGYPPLGVVKPSKPFEPKVISGGPGDYMPPRPALSDEQLIELERLASIGKAVEDANSGKLSDFGYVAVAIDHLKYRDHKKFATELWGTDAPKTADELADRIDTWTQSKKNEKAAP